MRCLFSVFLSIILLLWAGIPKHLLFGQRQHYLILATRGFLGGCCLIAGYISIDNLPIADSVVIGQLNPPITALAAWVILKEPLAPRGMLGCLLSLLGVVVLAHPPWLWGGGHEAWGVQRMVGTLVGVLSAAFAAGSYISIRAIGASEAALVVALWFYCGTVAITALPVLLAFPEHAVIPGPRDSVLMVTLSVLGFLGMMIMTRGFQLCTAGKASAIGFTGVIWGYFWGITIFHETITSTGLLGTVCVLVGVLLVTMKPKPAAAAPDAPGAAAIEASDARAGTPAASRNVSAFAASLPPLTSAQAAMAAAGGGSSFFQPRTPTTCPACLGRPGSQLRRRFNRSNSLPGPGAAAVGASADANEDVAAANGAATGAAVAASPVGTPPQLKGEARGVGHEPDAVGVGSRDATLAVQVRAGPAGVHVDGHGGALQRSMSGPCTAEVQQQQLADSAAGYAAARHGAVELLAPDVACKTPVAGAGAWGGAAAAPAAQGSSTIGAAPAGGSRDEDADNMGRPLLAAGADSHRQVEQQQQQQHQQPVDSDHHLHHRHYQQQQQQHHHHHHHRHHHHRHHHHQSSSSSSSSISSTVVTHGPGQRRATSMFVVGSSSTVYARKHWPRLRSLLVGEHATRQRQGTELRAAATAEDGHIGIDVPSDQLQDHDHDHGHDGDEEQEHEHTCAYCCGTGAVPVLDLARTMSGPLIAGIASAGSSAAIHGHDSHLHM